jgi:predicted peptidase
MPQTPLRFETTLVTPVALRYLLYLPDDHAARRDWPLLLFLHGAGERGDDLDRVRRHGPPRLLGEGAAWPLVVVSPQCPAGETWWEHLETLTALIDDVVGRCAIDEDRVLLTGLSLGGMGACRLASFDPHRFAALTPVCGTAPWAILPERLRHVPVWAFHGEDDEVVSPDESRELVAALRAVGGDARLTTYPGVGHAAWDPAYADPELLDWWLAARRRATGGASPSDRRGVRSTS